MVDVAARECGAQGRELCLHKQVPAKLEQAWECLLLLAIHLLLEADTSCCMSASISVDCVVWH
jgi:hypothetical protein